MPIVIDPSAGITGLVTPLAVVEGGNGNATGNVTSAQVAAEEARAVVRIKYDDMQTAIDAATTADAVKAAMPEAA